MGALLGCPSATCAAQQLRAACMCAVWSARGRVERTRVGSRGPRGHTALLHRLRLRGPAPPAAGYNSGGMGHASTVWSASFNRDGSCMVRLRLRLRLKTWGGRGRARAHLLSHGVLCWAVLLCRAVPCRRPAQQRHRRASP